MISNIVPPPLPVELGISKGYVGTCKESFSPIKLHFAVNKNDIDEVKTLINKRVDLNYMVFGQTPLAVSIFKECFDISCLLVDNGANLTQPEKSKWRRLPIHLASHSGNMELMEKMIERHPESINARDAMLFTPLHWAAAMGHVGAVELLIAKQSDIHATDDRGKSPLHRAAENNKIDVILCLLNNGANANMQDNIGWTPICQPIICQNLNLVELLLKKGLTDLKAKDIYGKTALHLSCNPKSEHNVWALCQASLDITTRHLKTATPAIQKVLLAPTGSSEDHVEMVSMLVNYGADCNVKDDNGDTPLSIAVKFGFVQLIVILVNAGSDIYNENWVMSKQWPESLASHTSIFGNIIRIVQNGPNSLKKLCKFIIRKHIRVKVDDNINQLPLPNYLLNYLLLSKIVIDE